MTDRAPFSPAMTFPRTYNAKSAREAGVVCRTCADDVIELGKCEVMTQYGNIVAAYDVERTLCDIVCGLRTVDVQTVVPAMRAYAASKDRGVPKLMEYARELAVGPKVRDYMEALL